MNEIEQTLSQRWNMTPCNMSCASKKSSARNNNSSRIHTRVIENKQLSVSPYYIAEEEIVNEKMDMNKRSCETSNFFNGLSTCGPNICNKNRSVQRMDNIFFNMRNRNAEDSMKVRKEEDMYGKGIWTADGKLEITCEKPVINVPLIQEIQRRDKIIEIPHIDVVHALLPKVYNQNIKHDVVSRINVKNKERMIEIPHITYLEKEVVVPVVAGYIHKFVPKWEIREVPKPVLKYVGKQEIINIDVPQVQFVDKIVENEVIVDTKEKEVPKITEIPEYVDTVKYVWKPVEKIVHVQRFVPKFDVSLECPAPLIVPYTVKRIIDAPSIVIKKSVHGLIIQKLRENNVQKIANIPHSYIQDYLQTNTNKSTLFSCKNPHLTCINTFLTTRN